MEKENTDLHNNTPESEKIHVGPENVTADVPNHEQTKDKKKFSIFDYMLDVQDKKLFKISRWVSTCIFFSSLIAYIVLGCTMHLWSKTWMIFLFCPVIPSIISSIARKKFNTFAMLFLVAGIYCACGMNIPNFWHPWWVLFFIPIVYHAIATAIDKHNTTKKMQKMVEAVQEELGNI